MTTKNLYPYNLNDLRFAGCHPDNNHASEIVCVILAESWLNRLRGTLHGRRNREMEDWVRNNRDVMDAFERSESVDSPDFGLFEQLQYPCEHCAATTTLRDAHLVCFGSDRLPGYEGFPEYLCADCTSKVVDGMP